MSDFDPSDIPMGYYRCEKCKTLIHIGTDWKPHRCVTNEETTYSYPPDRLLLFQMLNLLQDIKDILQELKLNE